MKYNIGQLLTTTEDFNVKTLLCGETKTIKKGTKMYVMANEETPQAILPDGANMRLESDAEIEGYSVKGIASWIMSYLRYRFPLNEMLGDYDETEKDFKDEIEEALEDLGMWDNTGNRS